MYRPPDAQPCERLICLIYELLDAHDDTARIAAGVAPYPIWQPHLAYLRDLQRLGREIVAAAARELEADSPGSREPPRGVGGQRRTAPPAPRTGPADPR